MNNTFSDRNELYPIFLQLNKLKVLIVGGGNVAEEKLHFLLKSSPGAKVHVVGKEVGDHIVRLAGKYGGISFERKAYAIDDLEGFQIIIGATNHRETNEVIYRDSKAQGKIVNIADTPDLCDFFMGSIVTKGHLKIALSSNGKSPTFVKRLRQILEDLIPDNINMTIDKLHEIRNGLKGTFEDKVNKLNELTAVLVEK